MQELKTSLEEKTQFETGLSKEIYTQTYKFGDDKNINYTLYRVAQDLASEENDPEFWTIKFYELLSEFKFVTGGRILSNAGTNLDGTSYINCFVSGPEGHDIDSMSSIMDELKRQALILKSEGGYGFCSDFMRPRGGVIKGIGAMSPGAVRMLDMWDTQSATITRGADMDSDRKDVKKKIRKGAQMVTMSIWHPDIEEFIKAKQTEGRLTKFNMSVLVSDKFMEAVKAGESWDLEFPDHEKHPEDYKKHWDGNINKWKALGYDTKVYKTYEDANELWDIIMQSTYNRNEPGILFVDRINELNNLYYNEHISATNPCGEQLLPKGGVCLLGSFNVTQYLKHDYSGWDFDKLERDIPLAVRMLDNVNDRTYVPLEEQRVNLKSKRRIGIGLMGLGSALMMQKVRYGSPKAVELVEELESFIANKCYQASANLAKEKEPFPLYEKHKYLDSKFVKRLDEDTRDMISQYGMRNSHLLSIQPTGNTSILANGVSGGLEPVFMHEYIRTSQQPFAPEGLVTPDMINWKSKSYTMPDSEYITEWEWIKEGDTDLLRTTFNDKVWKIDEARGLLKEELVEDYGVRHLKERGEWDPNADWAATTTELSVKEHTSVMSRLAYYIDSAMSKTVNLPNEYPYEDFKDLYMDMYESGSIKGGTTYRAGTMTSVLSSTESSTSKEGIRKADATKRPKELPCDIHKLRAAGGTWRVIVGLLDGEPYEVFAFKTHNTHLTETEGILEKKGKGNYDLKTTSGDLIVDDIGSKFETDEQEALTRMISSSLRHGMDVMFIVEQLSKSPGMVTSFNKAISRILSKYVSSFREDGIELECDCPSGEQKLAREEGCIKCMNCGASKCT